MWRLASAASSGSTNWINPKPRGSLQNFDVKTKTETNSYYKANNREKDYDGCWAHHKPLQIETAKTIPRNMEGHDKH